MESRFKNFLVFLFLACLMVVVLAAFDQMVTTFRTSDLFDQITTVQSTSTPTVTPVETAEPATTVVVTPISSPSPTETPTPTATPTPTVIAEPTVEPKPLAKETPEPKTEAKAIVSFSPIITPKPEPIVYTPGVWLGSGWTEKRPTDKLERLETLLTIKHNGKEYYFRYHKHDESRGIPQVTMVVGTSIEIELTIPDTVGIGKLKRNAYDGTREPRQGGEFYWKGFLNQETIPLVSNRKDGSNWIPLGTGGWNGKTTRWKIYATNPTKDFITASVTLMFQTASGEGANGGSESKYMPKIHVKVIPKTTAVTTISSEFQKMSGVNAYIHLPLGQKTADMTVYLAGSQEKDKNVLRYGLPEWVRKFGSNQIILVPIKKDGRWNADTVANTINEALDWLADNDYKVNRLYGDGFSAGGQGIAEVVANQKVKMSFTGIRLFGSNTNGKTAKLLELLRNNNLAGVTFYVGKNDGRFLNRAISDYQELAVSGKSNIYIVPNVGHRIDDLYAFANTNTS